MQDLAFAAYVATVGAETVNFGTQGCVVAEQEAFCLGAERIVGILGVGVFVVGIGALAESFAAAVGIVVLAVVEFGVAAVAAVAVAAAAVG